jgi:hypothetical protein
VLAQSRFVKVRLRRFVGETDRRIEVPAAERIDEHHAARVQVRVAQRLRKRVQFAKADVDFDKYWTHSSRVRVRKVSRRNCSTGCWCGPGPRSHSAGQFGAAESAEQVAHELHLLSCERDVAPSFVS